MSSLLRFFKHRTVIIILILIGLFGVVLLATPPVIRYYAVNWLRDHGAPHAEIRSVYFNPFSGTLFVLGLKASDNLAIGKAGVDVDWWPLWRHEVYIQDIDIENTTLGLTTDKKGRWKITGLNIPSYDNAEKSPSNSKSKPWRPVLQIAVLKNIHIKLDGDGLIADIPIHSLKLSHAFMTGEKHQTLNMEVRLGKNLATGHGYHLSDAGLHLQGQFTVPDSTTPFSTRKITVQIKKLAVESQTDHLMLAIGHILVSGASARGTNSIKSDEIEIKKLELGTSLKNPPSTPDRMNLATIRKASVRNLTVSGSKKVNFTRINIQGISLPSTEKSSLGNIGQIIATDGNMAPDSIQLAQLEFQNLNLKLEHQKNGLAVLHRLQAGFSPTPPAKTSTPVKSTSAPDARPTRINIGLITVDKGSKIDFRDSAVNPSFHTDLTVEKLRISPLDTSGKKSGEVDSVMQLGNQGKLSLNGNMKLQAAKSTAKLALDIKRLSMPSLTGYMENDFGHAIKTGQMDLNSHLSLQGDMINVKNRLAIRNLTLESSTQKNKAAQSLGMPLNMAVDMLRDDKGDIYLNIPIHGRIDDPKVDIHDAIDKAILSAMKTAALSYATLLLQPYGSILPAISLASKVMGNMSKPRLTPISFAPSSPALSTQAKAYIKKINALLKKKPFRLQVCGITSRFEMHPKSKEPSKSKASDAENKKMLSLAKARSVAVVKAIVSSGISADRVFDCLPSIDDKPHAVGRVELLLN